LGLELDLDAQVQGAVYTLLMPPMCLLLLAVVLKLQCLP